MANPNLPPGVPEMALSEPERVVFTENPSPSAAEIERAYQDALRSEKEKSAEIERYWNASKEREQNLLAELEVERAKSGALAAKVAELKQKAHDRARGNIAMLRGMCERKEIDDGARDFLIHAVSFDLLPEEQTNDES